MLDVSSVFNIINVLNGTPMALDGNGTKRAPPGRRLVHLTAAGQQVRPIGGDGRPDTFSGSHFRLTYVAPASR